MSGDGVVAHNRRTYFAENVDQTRTHLNIEYCYTPIEQAYHNLFDEALAEFNAKQKRKDRWLMELLVKSRASTFRGDYYSHGKQFIATLPIYKIDFENPVEVAKHRQIVEMVQNIMQLKSQLASAPNAARRTVLEHSIAAINTDLNNVIDELYQVESQEVEE